MSSLVFQKGGSLHHFSQLPPPDSHPIRDIRFDLFNVIETCLISNQSLSSSREALMGAEQKQMKTDHVRYDQPLTLSRAFECPLREHSRGSPLWGVTQRNATFMYTRGSFCGSNFAFASSLCFNLVLALDDFVDCFRTCYVQE